MSNLRFSEAEIQEMESKRNAKAIQIGRAVPYHLAYARIYKDNEILNPHLPEKRIAAAGQEKKTGKPGE